MAPEKAAIYSKILNSPFLHNQIKHRSVSFLIDKVCTVCSLVLLFWVNVSCAYLKWVLFYLIHLKLGIVLISQLEYCVLQRYVPITRLCCSKKRLVLWYFLVRQTSLLFQTLNPCKSMLFKFPKVVLRCIPIQLEFQRPLALYRDQLIRGMLGKALTLLLSILKPSMHSITS